MDRREGDQKLKTLIEGDFNARTRREGREVEEKGEKAKKAKKRRKSKDEKINREGRKLTEFVGENKCSTFNRDTKGDENRRQRGKRESEKNEDRRQNRFRSSACMEVWMKGDKRKNIMKKRRKENKRMWNEGRERIFQGEISL